MKYIQSFCQYPVVYSSISKGIPSKDADGELRNIAAFEDSELETLQRCEPLFRSLLNKKKYRILNKLPESYKPSSILVNEAMEEAKRSNEQSIKLQEELERLKAEKQALIQELEEEKAKEAGAAAEAEDETKEDEKVEEKDFSKMEYKELQEYAASIGIAKTNIKKAELIKAIYEASEKNAQG